MGALITCFAVLDLLATTLPERAFPEPHALASEVVRCLQATNADCLRQMIPARGELEAWFKTVGSGGERAVAQQQWLLKRSDSMRADDVDKQFARVQAQRMKYGVDLGKPLKVETKISSKYFYREADVFVHYAGGAVLKLKDCIETDKGWIFISEVALRM